MRVTIDHVRDSLNITETYDIMNAIRNSSSDQFQNYVPLANADNIADVGAGILINQAVQNEFITSLVDRIGLVVIRSVQLNNQLAKFKKGMMPLGRTIEEIFTDITKAKKYDAEDAEDTVFKREVPNVHTLFHERNRQDRYDQTIQDDSLKSAFVSWGNFEGFLASVINAMYNSAEVDEYEYMKLLVDNYYSKGLFTQIPVVKPDTGVAAEEFIKKMRATARKMTLPNGSRDYNSLAVRTRTDMDELHLLIDADLEAQVDVEVLAKAFNMNRADFLGHITVVDGFSSTGLEAVLIDQNWFMVYDNLLKMETIRNPKGLYWNYFYHVWQTLSVSRFSNAVAFVSSEVKPVTQVIVNPVIGSVKQGRPFQFTGYVRVTDGKDYDPVWSVEANKTGTTIDAGTTIDQNGLLTVGANQTGELLVKATVTYTDDEGTPSDETDDTTHDVVGEGIIQVVPQ